MPTSEIARSRPVTATVAIPIVASHENRLAIRAVASFGLPAQVDHQAEQPAKP